MTKGTQKIDSYQKLLEKYKEITIIKNIDGFLYWDLETYMPKKGIEQRAEELAFLNGMVHERITNPEIDSLLMEIKQHKNYENLQAEEKRNIFLIQRDYDRQTKIPKELVMEFTKQTTRAIAIWKKAKAQSNFKLFEPNLQKIFDLIKKQANFLDPNKTPYDVLLDIYEPGFNATIIDKLFKELRNGLIPLIQACVNSSKQPDSTLIERECPIDIQKQFSLEIAKLIKYDLSAGRIDETVHPFTGGYYDDVRITTHYDLKDFIDCFSSVMHEGGHALYEQNLPVKYKFQPIGCPCSAGIDEAQARFIENIIGRSHEFWEFYLPRFKKTTGTIFQDVKLDAFVHAVNRVFPTKIRVLADPVTYSLHVILRYEIEKDLLSDKVLISELPEVWNEKMNEYLGVKITNDTEGVLQDTHWAEGLMGYFPDYALGNIYDGQFLWKIEQEIPDWRTCLRKGDFVKIINWLIVNIHQKGNLYDPLDLIKKVTNQEISTKYYLNYLKDEFKKIYNFG